MRVIGGEAKGRRLYSPAGKATRPFTDRLRESLFSALGERVAGSRVLDLFAGTGSIGLEALSRGAESAVFVESNRAALQALRRNVDAVGLGGEVVAGAVEQHLDHLAGPFDLVFLDPPYPMSDEAVGQILERTFRVLTDDGVVVVHRRTGAELTTGSAMLSSVWHRRYGDAEVWWLQKEQET
jgi:16S rRNA (guanine966-N2)-methyltransferase